MGSYPRWTIVWIPVSSDSQLSGSDCLRVAWLEEFVPKEVLLLGTCHSVELFVCVSSVFEYSFCCINILQLQSFVLKVLLSIEE